MPKSQNPHKLSNEVIAEIVRMYTLPMSDGKRMGVTSIAKAIHSNPVIVWQHLKAAGIKLRDLPSSLVHCAHPGPFTNIPIGTPPLCKCGCGISTQWEKKTKTWQTYCVGHYRPRKSYHDPAWLRQEYIDRRRTMQDIGLEFGVGLTSIRKALRAAQIPIRTTSESLYLSGAVRGPKNPAWKGGVAQWNYSPDWKRIARRIRKRDDYTCQICRTKFQTSSKLLHVHHIDGNKFNCADDNLACTCATCHPKGAEQQTRAYWLSIVNVPIGPGGR